MVLKNIMKFELKPKYRHLVQKRYLCGPTCIQMVILRRNLGWIDQEKIAEELDARIMPAVKNSFATKLKTTKNESSVGLWLRELKGKKILIFFKKYKLPLKTKVFYVNKVKNAKSFIEENLIKNNDIMVNYWLKPFYKDRDNGHFSLISAINNSKVTLCDPSRDSKAFWEADIDILVESMSKQFDGSERGFVIFSKTQ